MHGRSSRRDVRQDTQPEPFPQGFAKGAYRATIGIREPVLERTVTPRYPAEALRHSIPADVEVLAVVGADGTLSARVLAAPDPRSAFEREALAAAGRYVFRPGARDGLPVPVVVTLVLGFRPPGGPPPAARVIGGTADPPAGLRSRLTSLAELPGPGLLRPLPVSKVYPPYPAGARSRRISGRVEMLAVLNADGRIGELEITRSLDAASGIDDAAAAAVRQWVFEPAIKNGEAVPVLMSVFVGFDRGS